MKDQKPDRVPTVYDSHSGESDGVIVDETSDRGQLGPIHKSTMIETWKIDSK